MVYFHELLYKENARWMICNQLLESDEFRFAYHEARRTVYICSLGLALAKASSKNTSVFIFKACSLKPSITVLGVGICEDLQVTERYLQYAKNAMYYDKKY